jgi:energy-coupling factor transporter ATP-binding protein EcfA2
MRLDIKPYDSLPVSGARQQAIIDIVNNKLAANPRQSFCFMGKPGSGKTTLMKAIQQYAASRYMSGLTTTKPLASTVVTLAEWHERNLEAVKGEAPAPFISAKTIRKVVGENRMWLSAGRPEPPNSLHFFLDEVDSQPTTSQFTGANWQSFINSVYDNSARNGGKTGNDTDWVQLVIAMNTTWAEFVQMYGQHVSRRIAEMCVVIDFDRESPVQTPPVSCSPIVVASDKAIERLLQ